MAQKTMTQAITGTLALKLEKDESVLISGEDVGNNGGVLRAIESLQEKFGKDRVFDIPLAESGIGGLAFGLVLQGYRPVLEIQFFGFVFKVPDEIVGQVARIHYHVGGIRNMPVTVCIPFGGSVHTPELHSDNLEELIVQSSGVRVVIPSDPYDTRELLISSIRSNDPVVYLERMKLYRSFREEVPDEVCEVPLDKAAVTREGIDASIIAYGIMVREAIKAADSLAKDNISAEIINLRTVAPLDVEAVINSAEKTDRVVVVQETREQASVGAMVVSEISGRAVLSLEAPIERVSTPDIIFLFGQAENIWLSNAKDIEAKAREIVES